MLCTFLYFYRGKSQRDGKYHERETTHHHLHIIRIQRQAKRRKEKRCARWSKNDEFLICVCLKNCTHTHTHTLMFVPCGTIRFLSRRSQPLSHKRVSLFVCFVFFFYLFIFLNYCYYYFFNNNFFDISQKMILST